MKKHNYAIIDVAIDTLIKGEKISEFAVDVLVNELVLNEKKVMKKINSKLNISNRINFFNTLALSIIETHNASKIYLFSLILDELPISIMEEGIIKTREYATENRTEEYVVKFSRNVAGANVGKLAEHICAFGNAQDIYDFAKYTPNAPINELAIAIMHSKNYELITLFAFEVPNAPKNEMLERVVKAKK